MVSIFQFRSENLQDLVGQPAADAPSRHVIMTMQTKGKSSFDDILIPVVKNDAIGQEGDRKLR
jgi:hypothetical protein